MPVCALRLALRRLAGGVLLVFSLAGVAAADGRVALVIRNDAYVAEAKLTNAVRDAGLVADALARAGFAVTRPDGWRRRDATCHG